MCGFIEGLLPSYTEEFRFQTSTFRVCVRLADVLLAFLLILRLLLLPVPRYRNQIDFCVFSWIFLYTYAK